MNPPGGGRTESARRIVVLVVCVVVMALALGSLVATSCTRQEPAPQRAQAPAVQHHATPGVVPIVAD